jgi:RNA recognition motif-containing protein
MLLESASSVISSRKIFVGGLSPTTTEDSLKNYFEKFGEVQDAAIMFDRDDKSRGFGFCTFTESSSLDKVFRLAHDVDGKKVECKRAVPKEAIPKLTSSGKKEEKRASKILSNVPVAPKTTVTR